MQATYLPTCYKNPQGDPSDHTDLTTRVSLAPENLAACLARYSRSNEGIGEILSQYGEKSPDAIFKFIDYGHASIGGLTGGIAIAIDQVSMLLAFKLFEFSQMADGQESSTRYICLDPKGVLSPQEIGLGEKSSQLLSQAISLGFFLYQETSAGLEEEVKKNPELARIPQGTPEKVSQRMQKNYALDRARYFLPMAAKTNLALIMSARMWAETLRSLQSLPWPEAQKLGAAISQELCLASPNLLRHSHADKASIAQAQGLLKKWRQETLDSKCPTQEAPCQTQVVLFDPLKELGITSNNDLEQSFEGKTNRYSQVGPDIKRQSLYARWSAMALAEVRDLNRHRTGFRLAHLSPKGFYLPPETLSIIQERGLNEKLKEFKNLLSAASLHAAQEAYEKPESLGLEAYALFLGSQVLFEHSQGLDKFIYEAELRTGLGAHFRYAQHLADACAELKKLNPAICEFISLGQAEPE